MKRSYLEHDAQAEVVRWLRAAGILFCAIPNGARTSMGVARKLKAEGLQKGAPDLLIFDPPPRSVQITTVDRVNGTIGMRSFVGLALEMKAPNGAKPRPEQIEWADALKNRGWVTLTCYGAAEALRELAALGYRVPG